MGCCDGHNPYQARVRIDCTVWLTADLAERDGRWEIGGDPDIDRHIEELSYDIVCGSCGEPVEWREDEARGIVLTMLDKSAGITQPPICLEGVPAQE